MYKNIKVILFDLDDTLIHTNRIFTKEINKIKKLVSQRSGVKYIEVKRFIDEAIIQNYSIAKVNPENLWPMTFKSLKEKFQLDNNLIAECEKIIFGIYKILPKVKSGAVKLLKKLKEENIKLGLVTHATKEWTDFKLDGNKLRQYFDYIEVVDVNRFKLSTDWVSALNMTNFTRDEACIVGDNIKGDIIAGYEAGFKNLIWVKKEDGWSVYKTGELPKGAKKASNLKDVYNIIFPK